MSLNSEPRQSQVEFELIVDEPIIGDSATPDRLNRVQLARAAATLLRDQHRGKGFVLAIEGAWGSGKTSFCNLMKGELKLSSPKDLPMVVNFNPWLFADRDQLTKAFLKQLSASLSLPDIDGIQKGAAQKIKTVTRIAKVAKRLPVIGELGELLEELQAAMNEYADALENMADAKKFDLESRKRKVTHALERIGRPIVVFVDDLDRLVPAEIFEMIRLIKAVGDFPYLRYVVTYDSKYVVAALKQYGLPDPNSYLEKIFQVRFPLPPCDKEDLKVLLEEQLNALPEELRQYQDKDTNDLYGLTYHYGLREIVETPRDIVRAFASVRTKAERCKGEVNLPEIVALEFIANKAPDVYRHIINRPELWTGETTSLTASIDGERRAQEHATERRASFDGLAPHITRSLERLTQFIFPYTVPPDRHQLSGSGTLRIAQPDRLRYFINCGLPRNEVANADVVAFVHSQSERQSILEGIFASDRQRRFFSLLAIEIGKTPPMDLFNFLAILGDFLDRDGYRAKWVLRSEIFDRSARELVDEIVTQVILSAPENARRESTKNGIAETYGREMSIIIVDGVSGALATSQQGNGPPDTWGSEANLRSLMDKWTKTQARLLPIRMRQGQHVSGRAISLFARNAAPSHIKKFLAQFTSTSEIDNLVVLLAAGGRSSHGEFASVRQDILAKLNGIDWWKQHSAKRLKSSSLSMRLRSCYRSILENKNILLETGNVV